MGDKLRLPKAVSQNLGSSYIGGLGPWLKLYSSSLLPVLLFLAFGPLPKPSTVERIEQDCYSFGNMALDFSEKTCTLEYRLTQTLFL